MAPNLARVQLAIAMGLCFGLYSSVVARASMPIVNNWAEFTDKITNWTHSAYLDDHLEKPNIRLLWTPSYEEVYFRVEARTKGYVGIGFSKNGRMAGADMAIGWVKDGQAFLQDRHAIGRLQPQLDKHQNWYLIAGYENETHTSIIFKRKYVTCDKEDIRITNDTMRVIYAHGDKDPDHVTRSLLPHGSDKKGVKSLLLTQHSGTRAKDQDHILTWDLRSQQVALPKDQDTLYWCKLFKLPNMTAKHHMVGYEPLIQPGNEAYMHHLLVHECTSRGSDDDARFEAEVSSEGHRCHFDLPNVFKSCQTLMVVWAFGSKGFFLPENIGYSLDPTHGARYFKLEIHYDNPYLKRGIRDSSGLRIFYTPKLRQSEAGLFSVGIEPEWQHMIPPKQPAVVSYGHCVSQCTEKAFPSQGIHVFATVLHTHLIGRKLQLRHIRNGTEFAPISEDANFDPHYQEFRTMGRPIQVLPGDHLIAECTYNSKGRDGMTSGGFSTREEMCLIYVYHYPKIKMSSCYSLPTMPTVYSSVGVEEIWRGRVPERIKRPLAFANLTLKEHTTTHNWSKHFKRFQEVTKWGAFRASCGTEDHFPMGNRPYHFPNITKKYHEPPVCGQEEVRPLPVHDAEVRPPTKASPAGKPKHNPRNRTTHVTLKTTTEKMQSLPPKPEVVSSAFRTTSSHWGICITLLLYIIKS